MGHLTTVIPVYNGERFLEATLESVARQDRRPDRVIIQDNCSTDDTPRIAQAFAREGFEWRRVEPHLECIDHFNLAFRFAEETDVLHLLTADDLVKPAFYQRLLESLERTEGHALAYSAYEVIDEDGQLERGGDLVNPFPIEPGMPARKISPRQLITSQADLRTICMPAVLMKTNRQPLPVGLRPGFIQCADAVFFAELTSTYRDIHEVPEALCQFRRHAHSATSQNRAQPGALIADEWRAMVIISGLLGKAGWSARFWNFRQRCLLAASSRVLLQTAEDVTPQYRNEVRQATREITGSFAWWLGNLAVVMRGVIRRGRHQI